MNRFESGYSPEQVEEDPIEADLARQYENMEEVEIHGSKVKIVDIAPEHLKTEVPTFLIAGFSDYTADLKGAAIKIAKSGRRVIAGFAAHGIEGSEQQQPSLPEAEQRKLALLLEVIKRKGVDKLNAVACSEGAIAGTAAARLSPDQFENLILVEGAGMIGKDSVYQLLKRSIAHDAAIKKSEKEFPPEVTKGKFQPNKSDNMKVILSDIRATVQELQAISQADITEDLKDIHDHGVGVSIIHAVDDTIFPMERVQQMVKADMIDGFYSVRGHHENLYLYEPFGEVVEQALSALEKKREAKAETI